jgi:enamine deaminase RidA (YjgF/YER057c/UK114 family)
MITREDSRQASAERRLKELDIKLPTPPEPFGAYVEAVQTGNLLFLSGMLPTEGHAPKMIGRVGAELDVEAGRQAAYLAALNVLAVTRQHLGSLDKVMRIVRLGVSVATSGDVRDHPKCPFQNFLNRLNQLDFKGGGLIRGGVADVDA